MKKLFLSIVTFLLVSSAAQAQKYAIIDSKYILEKIKDYTAAQKTIEDLSKQWQSEIDQQMAQVSKLYETYQAERAMLSEPQRKKREDEIIEKEKAIKDLQKRRFGYEGELFVKQQELIKPIQEKVYNAVQKFAAQRGLEFILDKSAGTSLFYVDPKLDKSDEILKTLGVN